MPKKDSDAFCRECLEIDFLKIDFQIVLQRFYVLSILLFIKFKSTIQYHANIGIMDTFIVSIQLNIPITPIQLFDPAHVL